MKMKGIMKGVILAGGSGTRLYPCTKVTNKHLLPVYNKPMIFYPLQKMIDAGIKDVLVVTGTESASDFMKLLGSGKDYGIRLTYRIQDGSGGIAHALALAEGFINPGEKFVVILGDNIIEDDISSQIRDFIQSPFEAMIFLKEVEDPERFGVAKLEGNHVASITEKPKVPETNFAVAGLYIYSYNVFDIIRELKPSARGEYEITDVNNQYIKRGTMIYSVLKGFWSDAGTFHSLYRAATLVREKQK